MRPGFLSFCALVAIALTLPPGLSAQKLVFYDSFDQSAGLPEGWSTHVDGSVSCPAPYKVSPDDVATYVLPGDWPEGHRRVMTSHANVRNKPGIVANSISARFFDYQGPGTYNIDLEMRLWRTDGIYKNEYYGVNLTFSRKEVDYFAEVNIDTDPESPNQGWLVYRHLQDGQLVRSRIAFAGVNSKWHRLIVNIHVDVRTRLYILESVWFEGEWYVLSEPLPYRKVPGWKDYQVLFVESHALYRHCDPSLTYQGIAVFDNVALNFYPF